MSPQDNLLNIYNFNNKKDISIIPTAENIVIPEKDLLLVDNCAEIESPAEISISKYEIDFIVGKERSF